MRSGGGKWRHVKYRATLASKYIRVRLKEREGMDKEKQTYECRTSENRWRERENRGDWKEGERKGDSSPNEPCVQTG